MSTSRDFGQLRSILNAPPSPQALADLIRTSERLRILGTPVEALRTYIDDHARTWRERSPTAFVWNPGDWSFTWAQALRLSEDKIDKFLTSTPAWAGCIKALDMGTTGKVEVAGRSHYVRFLSHVRQPQITQLDHRGELAPMMPLLEDLNQTAIDHIGLDSTLLDADPMSHVANAIIASKLAHLSIRAGSQLDLSPFEVIGDCALESLHIERCQIEGFAALGDSGALKGLKTLSLTGTRLRDREFIGALKGGSPESLTHLNITGNTLTDSAFEVFDAGSKLDKLVMLVARAGNSTNFSGAWNTLGEDGVKLLASGDVLGRLTHLSLGLNRMGSRAALRLFGADAPRMEALDLIGCHIGNRALELLAKRQTWTNLSMLLLQKNKIADSGFCALVRSPVFANVRVLDVSSNEITRAGLDALATSPHTGSLTHLMMAGNKLPKGAIKAFLNTELGQRLEFFHPTPL